MSELKMPKLIDVCVYGSNNLDDLSAFHKSIFKRIETEGWVHFPEAIRRMIFRFNVGSLSGEGLVRH